MKIKLNIVESGDEEGLRKHVDIVKKTISSVIDWISNYA